MKKIHSVLATAMLATATVFSGGAALASDSDGKEHRSEQIDASDYNHFPGNIVEAEQHENHLNLFMEGMNKEPARLIISEDTLLFDAATGETVERDALKEGTRVDAYYNKHKFMIMIYPPQIAPEIVIVHGEQSGQAKVGKFDEDGVSLDGQLRAHIDENTTLVNQQGEPIEKNELRGKELIVFYDIATKSLPAHATAKKIIALDPLETEPRFVPEPILDDLEPIATDPAPAIPDPNEPVSYTPPMVQLREAAEKLGYDLRWDESSSSVTMTNEKETIRLTIGSLTYTRNGQTESFDAAPVIREGRTYLPDTFIATLTQ